MCNQYTFYIAHMETELESHSFQHWTLGSYVLSTCSCTDMAKAVGSIALRHGRQGTQRLLIQTFDSWSNIATTHYSSHHPHSSQERATRVSLDYNLLPPSTLASIEWRGQSSTFSPQIISLTLTLWFLNSAAVWHSLYQPPVSSVTSITWQLSCPPS